MLIVEDDAETGRFDTDTFAFDGFRTQEAHNGFQALEKPIAAAPDLVLTDMSAPGIDGG